MPKTRHYEITLKGHGELAYARVAYDAESVQVRDGALLIYRVSPAPEHHGEAAVEFSGAEDYALVRGYAHGTWVSFSTDDEGPS